jgi:DNA-binding NtrC family response regulator
MQRVKILIVDDEQVVLDSCRKILESEGYDVFLSSSAVEALEAMKTDGFSLILIDVKMPGRDGMYLIGELNKHWPRIQVVVMSGYHTNQTIEKAKQMGAVSFINKPFTPDELINSVREALEKQGDT